MPIHSNRVPLPDDTRFWETIADKTNETYQMQKRQPAPSLSLYDYRITTNGSPKLLVATAFTGEEIEQYWNMLNDLSGPISLREDADHAQETLSNPSIVDAMSQLEGTISIRLNEEPLTAHNLNIIISALTELSTKYWLIAKGRFADLIEYTQTHNGRFAEEANIVVTRITYNSPMNMDWKVDLSAPSVAEALVITIDGITLAPKRLKQKELENQAKAQEIQHAEQQAAHEQQMAALEHEQRRLEIEKQRLEILEKQLEVQKR